MLMFFSGKAAKNNSYIKEPLVKLGTGGERGTASSKKSLKLQIGIIYTVLALINIIFFSVMIFENQMDLMINNFKYHADTIVKAISGELEQYAIGKEEDENFQSLKKSLLVNNIKSFYIFTSDGTILHKYQDSSSVIPFPENYADKIKILNSQSAFMKSRYTVELDNKDFSVQFFALLNGKDGISPYLFTSISVKAVLDRLKQLYFQIALAVVWGAIFHIFFAIYLFRVIFRRLSILQTASISMGEGNLKARAEWQKKKKDELDELGDAFNNMAGKIESTISTISRLNKEVQVELSVGKQVQELLLPQNQIFEDYKVAVYYRPLREVSGDIYHFEKISDMHKSLFLADATGHGVSAALVTSIIMMNLRSIKDQTTHPIKVMQKLSFRMNQLLQCSFFASGIYVLFENDRRIYFSNAGHPSPLLFKKDSETIHQLPVTGGMLAMSDDPEDDLDYSGKSTSLQSGDKLVFYTDGINEAMNKDGDMFSVERLERILLENSTKSPQEILDIYVSELNNFINKYKDDVTVIVMEVP